MTKAEQWDPSLENILDACPAAIWREMAWAIGSAPMLQGNSTELPFLWRTDYHTRALRSFRDLLPVWEMQSCSEIDVLGDRPMRLGKRFEQLVNWWFEACPEYEVLAKNLVIQGKDRTLGEMDLVVRDAQTSLVLHLELACKFYLQTRVSSSWNHWVGMDSKDRLDVKLAKLESQLKLDKRPETQSVLRERGIRIDTRAAWVKGWCFVHYRNMTRAKLPHQAHRSVSSGWWCTLSEWSAIWQPQSSWVLIPAEHWLRVQHKKDDALPIHSLRDVEQAMKEWKHAMVAQVETCNGRMKEIMRGIIVRDAWPNV